MFGISAVEFILLVVVAVILFGPEKLPEFSRKAARVFVYVRDIANNAQTQLRSELGPEYSDLSIEDLNPKTFVAKHMKHEIELLEEAKRELSKAETEVKSAAKLVESQAKDAEQVARARPGAAALAAGTQLIFDDEAT